MSSSGCGTYILIHVGKHTKNKFFILSKDSYSEKNDRTFSGVKSKNLYRYLNKGCILSWWTY